MSDRFSRAVHPDIGINGLAIHTDSDGAVLPIDVIYWSDDTVTDRLGNTLSALPDFADFAAVNQAVITECFTLVRDEVCVKAPDSDEVFPAYRNVRIPTSGASVVASYDMPDPDDTRSLIAVPDDWDVVDCPCCGGDASDTDTGPTPSDVSTTLDGANPLAFGEARELCPGGASISIDAQAAAGGSLSQTSSRLINWLHNNSSNGTASVTLANFDTISELVIEFGGVNESGETPINWSLAPDSFVTSGNNITATWDTSLAGLQDLALTFEQRHPASGTVSSFVSSISVSGTSICPE